MSNATITNVTHHHMPDGADYPVRDGMTLRQALAAIRDAGRVNYGDIGGMHAVMSDGTDLSVECQSATGGGELMSSQVITRTIGERVSTLAW